MTKTFVSGSFEYQQLRQLLEKTSKNVDAIYCALEEAKIRATSYNRSALVGKHRYGFLWRKVADDEWFDMFEEPWWIGRDFPYTGNKYPECKTRDDFISFSKEPSNLVLYDKDHYVDMYHSSFMYVWSLYKAKAQIITMGASDYIAIENLSNITFELL